jgi:hypothetical protein
VECITTPPEVQQRAGLARRFLPKHVHPHRGSHPLHPERRAPKDAIASAGEGKTAVRLDAPATSERVTMALAKLKI